MTAVAPVPMRETTPPAYVATMAQLRTYGEVAEVVKSPHSVQGSHREPPFFADSLLFPPPTGIQRSAAPTRPGSTSRAPSSRP